MIMDSDLETAKTLALVAIILDLLGLLFSLLFLPLAILPFIFILLNYFLIYKPLSEGRGRDAETPALVLGILQIIPFGGVIPGILLLISWVKIRDSMGRS